MNLPPIEYFYGRTPLAIWISNCRPFDHKGLGKSVSMVKFVGKDLSPMYKLYIKAIEHDMEVLQQQINEYFNMNRFL